MDRFFELLDSLEKMFDDIDVSARICPRCIRDVDDFEALLNAVATARRIPGGISIFLLDGALRVTGGSRRGVVNFFTWRVWDIVEDVGRRGVNGDPTADIVVAMYLRRMLAEPGRIPEIATELGRILASVGVQCGRDHGVRYYADVPVPTLCVHVEAVARYIGVAAVYVLRGMGMPGPSFEIDVEGVVRGDVRLVYAKREGNRFVAVFSDGAIYTQFRDSAQVFPGLLAVLRRGEPSHEVYRGLWMSIGKEYETRRRIAGASDVFEAGLAALDLYLRSLGAAARN